MDLSELISTLDRPQSRGGLTLPVTGLSCDSRVVRPGDAFVCVRGFQVDGHEFVEEALRRGAGALVVERFLRLPQNVPQVLVSDSREALALLSAKFYGHPSSQMRVVGVTGTNGKTTVTYLLEAILEHAGSRTGRIGTVENKIGDRARPAQQTTPGPLELQRMLRDMVETGCRYAVMEVSSHALAQHRVTGCEFAVAVFTNLGHDHLDFHRDLTGYLEAKLRLFSTLSGAGPSRGPKYAVVNADDEHWRIIAERTPCPVVTFGLNPEAQIRAEALRPAGQHSQFRLVANGQAADVWIQLPGQFNVLNALAAAAVAVGEGVPLQTVVTGLSSVSRVPGRGEILRDGHNRTVIVDFAHNPEALRQVLLLARQEAAGRDVIAVFGCEGRKDRSKRPLMGRVAAEFADYCIITSDNLYDEDPLAIAQEIEQGIRDAGAPSSAYTIIPDRFEAIQAALEMAKRGAMVVVAGKGHETEWIVGERRIPFNDREVVERLLGRDPL